MDDLQRRVSSKHFTELLAYEEIQPHGERRSDLRAGIIASTIANASRSKHSQPFAPKDFIVDFDVTTKRQTNEQIKRNLQLFTAMSGGKFNG